MKSYIGLYLFYIYTSVAKPFLSTRWHSDSHWWCLHFTTNVWYLLTTKSKSMKSVFGMCLWHNIATWHKSGLWKFGNKLSQRTRHTIFVALLFNKVSVWHTWGVVGSSFFNDDFTANFPPASTTSSATAEKQRVSCPLPSPSGYTYAYDPIGNPQQTYMYVKRAVRKAHFKTNRVFKVIQGHP